MMSRVRSIMQRSQELSKAGALTCDGAFLACQVRSLVRCKMLVDYGIQAACLVHVAVDSVLDVLWGITVEVVWIAVSSTYLSSSTL